MHESPLMVAGKDRSDTFNIAIRHLENINPAVMAEAMQIGIEDVAELKKKLPLADSLSLNERFLYWRWATRVVEASEGISARAERWQTGADFYFVSPARLEGREIVADTSDGRLSLRVTDAVDRIGLRNGRVYAVWEFTERELTERPTTASADEHAQQNQASFLLVHVGGGELMQLDPSYRLHLHAEEA